MFIRVVIRSSGGRGSSSYYRSIRLRTYATSQKFRGNIRKFTKEYKDLNTLFFRIDF